MRLEDKTVLITGAGSGLGRESCLLFAEEGARIVVTDVNEERANGTAALVREAGGSAQALAVDVTNETQVRTAVEFTVQEYGKLDVMFNNAGIPSPGFGRIPFEELTEEAWRRVIDVNLTGVFFGCKHAVPALRENGGGSIVITSSAASLVGFKGFSIYGASKGGVNALVRGLAVDLGPDNIRVNAVCPMYGMSANFAMPDEAAVLGKSYEEVKEEWDPTTSRIPLKATRPPGLRDTAYAALFLASDESLYMSGVCLPTADGGTLSHVAM